VAKNYPIAILDASHSHALWLQLRQNAAEALIRSSIGGSCRAVACDLRGRLQRPIRRGGVRHAIL